MNKAIGLAALVAGVILLVIGFTKADSPASDISRFFTGQPTDKAVWFLVIGAVLIVFGGVIAAISGRSLKNT